MRYSKEHKQETHARIVRKASVRLREKGAHGIGVADLMKEAGLTHGGFYAHFDSREALVIEAFGYAMDRSMEHWRKTAAEIPPEKRLSTIVDSYLTTDASRRSRPRLRRSDAGRRNRAREPEDPQGLCRQARADDRHDRRSDSRPAAQGRAQAGFGHAGDHDGNAGAVAHRWHWRVFRGNSGRRPRGRARPSGCGQASGEEGHCQGEASARH